MKGYITRIYSWTQYSGTMKGKAEDGRQKEVPIRILNGLLFRKGRRLLRGRLKSARIG